MLAEGLNFILRRAPAIEDVLSMEDIKGYKQDPQYFIKNQENYQYASRLKKR